MPYVPDLQGGTHRYEDDYRGRLLPRR